MTGVCVWHEGALKEKKLEKHLADERQATADVKARASAAEANFKVLQADLHKKKTDFNRLTTELA